MARNTSFYYSFFALPRDQRRALIAVWDFCRAVDDAVDERCTDGANDDPRVAVQFWRDELARCYSHDHPVTSQGRQLQPFVARFNLPRRAFDDVIDGVAMDIDTTSYETFEELLTYCHRVASAVGMICIEIFGCQGPTAREYALQLGVALQLTNILRDIPDDLKRGRLYLPQEDMAAAGCTVADLRAAHVSTPVRRLLEFQCARARRFYDRAVAARPEDDRRRLVAAEIMRAVYFETLRRIERSGYDVFSGHARVPRPAQAIIAFRQWLWPV